MPASFAFLSIRHALLVALAILLLSCSSPATRTTLLSPTPARSQLPSQSSPSQSGSTSRATYDSNGKLKIILNAAGKAISDPKAHLVFVCNAAASKPILIPDDLTVAFRTVLAGQDPGVSIDPGPTRDFMVTRYIGQVPNTHFGLVMFEADRLMKNLSLGKDNVTGQSITSRTPGHIFQCDNQSANAFAEQLTRQYDAYASEFPVLQELVHLAKWVSIVKWMQETDKEFDAATFSLDGMLSVNTPDKTPAIKVTGQQQKGSSIQTITLYGGVDLGFQNTYVPQSPLSGPTLGSEVENA